MDDIEQLKQDIREGRIDPDRLVGVLLTLQRRLGEANRRIEELEKKLGGSATAKRTEPFSMRAEEQRQQARGKKSGKRKRPRRQGRITTADKIALAQRTEKAFPVGVAQEDCSLSHTRPVWRLENGQAVLVAYEVYRGPKNQYGVIPGTLGRSEFGLEFIVAIAYQVYIVGLSFDKVCLLMNFFQNLRLRKSQANSLMNQLSRHWASEFDRLCTLLAHSAVVHADETSWSLRSVWAFLSEKVRLLFFGVHKDADGRLGDAGRKRKVAELDDEIFELCGPMWCAALPPLAGTDNDYRLLCNELMRLMLAQQLFTFVTATPVATPSGEAKPIAGTNNEAERTLRGAAQARDTGRTNKTLSGARRQTIISSVMESLRQQLPIFTLSAVITEILRWERAGRSCFADLMAKLKLSPPAHSVLDALLPVPGG